MKTTIVIFFFLIFIIIIVFSSISLSRPNKLLSKKSAVSNIMDSTIGILAFAIIMALSFTFAFNFFHHIVDIDASNLFTYMSMCGAAVIFIYNGIYNILFVKSKDIPEKVHLLLWEYNFISNNTDPDFSVWIIEVKNELNRFGLGNTQLAKYVSNHSGKEIRLSKEEAKLIAHSLAVLAGEEKVHID